MLIVIQVNSSDSIGNSIQEEVPDSTTEAGSIDNSIHDDDLCSTNAADVSDNTIQEAANRSVRIDVTFQEPMVIHET